MSTCHVLPRHRSTVSALEAVEIWIDVVPRGLEIYDEGMSLGSVTVEICEIYLWYLRGIV